DKFDFRQVVREAKGKVFPAVVFIKVLREDMQRGEKLTQEVSGSGVLCCGAGVVSGAGLRWGAQPAASDSTSSEAINIKNNRRFIYSILLSKKKVY
ncbi:MAG TPA: hypothetical protein PK684_10310, partial [Bacillota bacterium]|nr:hypothetical protein [Bacillota bacterium]